MHLSVAMKELIQRIRNVDEVEIFHSACWHYKHGISDCRYCRDNVFRLSADRGLTPFSAPRESLYRIENKKESSRSR